MLFQDLRVQDIKTVIRYFSHAKHLPLKKRNSHILGIKLSGSAVHYFADRTLILESGMVYFLNQQEPYAADVLEYGVGFSVHFTSTAPIAQKSFFAAVEDPQQLIRCLENLEESYQRSGNCPAALSDLYRLIDGIIKLVQLPESEKNRRMADAKAYMDIHFKEKNCISEAAKCYGVTVRRFTDLFSQSFRTTPNRYLQQRKIEQAGKLLEIRELSLAQVAELSGFSDVYYFSKAFKQATGVSPGTKRKQF